MRPRPAVLLTAPTVDPRLSFLAQFLCNVSPSRINTHESASKQATLTTFRINTYEKQAGWGRDPARSAVLLTPSRPPHLAGLLSRQLFASVSSLSATFTGLLASVANKRLAASLNPLDATLTKNMGVGAPPFDARTFKRSDVQTAFPPPATLLYHGTPTPRPTLPRRSPLARGDCARHPRFATFHRPASQGRPRLLDRNWFGAW